jgi:hypothetical protein
MESGELIGTGLSAMLETCRAALSLSKGRPTRRTAKNQAQLVQTRFRT